MPNRMVDNFSKSYLVKKEFSIDKINHKYKNKRGREIAVIEVQEHAVLVFVHIRMITDSTQVNICNIN